MDQQIAEIMLYDVTMSFGDRFRERRTKVGLTLGQVGEYEGVTAQYLSDLERGRNDPNVWRLLARLAKRYRTSADYLLALTDDPTPFESPSYSEQARAAAELVDGLPAEQRAGLVDLLRGMVVWASGLSGSTISDDQQQLTATSILAAKSEELAFDTFKRVLQQTEHDVQGDNAELGMRNIVQK